MDDDRNGRLVASSMQGDAAALEALLVAQLPSVHAYVRLHAGQLLQQKESCGDLVQSACREALRDLHDFEYRGEAPFRKWLYAKVLAKIVDRQRYWLAGRRHPGREVAIDASTNTAPLQAAFASPSQVAIQAEDLAALARAFQTLPDDYREVITLSRLCGFGHSEIAQQMHKSEGALRVLLHRALVRLAAAMGSDQASDR